jgi:lipopolysaccharide export system protein LptA
VIFRHPHGHSSAQRRLGRISLVFGFCWILSSGLSAVPAAAQLGGALNRSDGPLEIDAEQGIEWRRKEKLYIARGNARAASGGLEVYGETLTAHYRTDEAGSSEVFLLEVEGDVKIVTEDDVVYGDYGRYSLDDEHLILTGQDLRLESKNGRDKITAEDSLEYFDGEKRAVAKGNARARHDDQQIRADTLVAFFAQNKNDKMQVDRVEAEGNVRVRTPTEVAMGDKGVYFVEDERATLSGDVKITRDDNQLNGEYAEVNLATGVSRLTGGASGERVHGLVLPTAQKKSDGKSGKKNAEQSDGNGTTAEDQEIKGEASDNAPDTVQEN